MKTPPIVTEQEWQAARQRLLVQEKEVTRARDALAARRRLMPWLAVACPGCSLVADQVAQLAHLNARDTTLAFVSRAPQQDIEKVKARMGWAIPRYTLTDEFDLDHGVDEWHGTNAFIREGDRVFRTYFVNNRGDETMGSTWSYLDITALGRQEEWEDSPEGYPRTPPYSWWRWHDSYEDSAAGA